MPKVLGGTPGNNQAVCSSMVRLVPPQLRTVNTRYDDKCQTTVASENASTPDLNAVRNATTCQLERLLRATSESARGPSCLGGLAVQAPGHGVL